MQTNLRSPLVTCAAMAVVLLLGTGEAHAQRGRGYYHGPYHGYGYYRPYGYYPGWYRPYPFIGVGIGFYAPYYGSYAYPLPPGVAYPPYPYAPMVAGSSPAPGVPTDQAAPQPTEKPPPDNAGHLQLLVPAGATVLINGQKIGQTGATREVVTPALQPGTRYTYKIEVQYTDAQGKQAIDARDITFQANDWFSVDFTRAAPPRAPAAPPPQPLPNPLR